MPFGFIHDYVPTEYMQNKSRIQYGFSLDLVLVRIEFVVIETCVL
jgi:hypothetical protein